MIVDRFDCVLLDLDGVIYRGEQTLPHAIGSVNRLRELGKTVRFLTNDPRETPETVLPLICGSSNATTMKPSNR